MTSLLGAFIFQVGIITYRSGFKTGGVKVPTAGPLPVPLPADYTAAALIYGTLALAPDSLAPVAGLVGWGLVVATLLNLFNPTFSAPVAAPVTPVTAATPGA